MHVAAPDDTEVTGSVPAVVVERASGRVRIAPVAEEDRSATQADLADLPFGQDLASLRVADLHLHGRGRHADAVGMCELWPRAQCRTEAGGLRAAVPERGACACGGDAFRQCA